MNPEAGARLPVAHRAARSLGARGVRCARLYWWLAERLSPLPGRGLVHLPGDIPLAFDPRDWVAENAYRGLYERAVVATFARLLSPGDVVVDVGANIGYLTAHAARLVGPSGRVVSVEPSSRCLASLRTIVPMLRARIDLIEAAAGREDGVGVLTLSEADGQLGHGTLRRGDDVTGDRVPVRPLDLVLDELGIQEIGLVKIDVEGFERQAIEGLSGHLAGGLVRDLLIEVSPEFGPVDWAAGLVGSMSPTHDAFLVVERGGLISRPRLRRVGPSVVAGLPRQQNLLITRRRET